LSSIGNTGQEKITVTWSAPSNNGGFSIIGYRVILSGETEATYPISSLSYSKTIPNLDCTITYGISVGAQNSKGWSQGSSQQSLKPNCPPTPTPVPSATATATVSRFCGSESFAVRG
jgi:hypothetical protein